MRSGMFHCFYRPWMDRWMRKTLCCYKHRRHQVKEEEMSSLEELMLLTELIRKSE